MNVVKTIAVLAIGAMLLALLLAMAVPLAGHAMNAIDRWRKKEGIE